MPRSPGAQLDWRVSRALLHAVRKLDGPGRALSLSHKRGHAVCASAPAGWQVGVDLECIRKRDVLRLAAWVCSLEERQHLAQLAGVAQLECFHVLWTLKEAFIKAAGLAFPQDMASIGLHALAGTPALRAPPGSWQAAAWRLGTQWLAACVWQAGQGRALDARAAAALPGWRSPLSALPPSMRPQQVLRLSS